MRRSPRIPSFRRGLLLATALVVLTWAPVGARANSPADGTRVGAAAPQPTQTSLSNRSRSVRSGSFAVLIATLKAGGRPLEGRKLALKAGSAEVATDVTDRNGRARFKVRAARTASYQAGFTPASSGEAAAYGPSVSGAVEVVARPSLTLSAGVSLHVGKTLVGLPGERIRVAGRFRPYTVGERVVVTISRHGRVIRRSSRPIVKRRAAGRFGLWFTPRRRGSYVLRAEHRVSATLGAVRASRKRLTIVRPRARVGSRGLAVHALQRRLTELGYVTRVNGVYGSGTGRAVLALRKVIGARRLTSVGSAIFRRLARGGGGFRVRYPKAGRHVEFDWSRQVVVFVRGARPVKVLHASSGKPSTPTVFGKFRFYSKTPGFNSKGMYFSNYFIGGYAIHGYPSVPNYAASHGCIRIPIPSAKSVYRWVRLGDRIFVYR